ncbi:Hsp20 family protein [Candidatus Arsenophonus nilaparvatae]|uniref:Hsp20 family protein n=1 Tax=Candidatus Arsenophonus nilaparvatae TaxID=1247023 RepID=UPI000840A61F|nr:Hsp20 family protein [Candidatus Arsenophonus nilaparvatae]
MIRPLRLFPTLTNDLYSDRFDKIDKLFSHLTGVKPLSLPSESYNLKKIDDTHYELIISVPGFTENELDVSFSNGQLFVVGDHKEETPKKGEWLHQGISHRSFSAQYSLGKNAKIQNAELCDGLLKIHLEYEIPKDEKVKKITIKKGKKNESKKLKATKKPAVAKKTQKAK